MAIVLYYLLFNSTPFNGVWNGTGNPPSPEDLIRGGHWVHAPYGKLRPGPLTIPLEIVHPSIGQAFIRCFTDGHKNPSARPSAEEWTHCLRTGLDDLVTCDKDPGHHFSKSYGKCYWCERKKNLNGFDIFPSSSAKGHSTSSTSGPNHVSLFRPPKPPRKAAKRFTPKGTQAISTSWLQPGCKTFTSSHSMNLRYRVVRGIFAFPSLLLILFLGTLGLCSLGNVLRTKPVNEKSSRVVMDTTQASRQVRQAAEVTVRGKESLSLVAIKIFCHPWATAELVHQSSQHRYQFKAPMREPGNIPPGSYDLFLSRNGSRIFQKPITILSQHAYEIRIRLDLGTFDIVTKEDAP